VFSWWFRGVKLSDHDSTGFYLSNADEPILLASFPTSRPRFFPIARGAVRIAEMNQDAASGSGALELNDCHI
jgi:hypothetical protein